tara:strand:- start:274 stop:480 length:207 start_codon:yes stop_codon:yes gene_type:complete
MVAWILSFAIVVILLFLFKDFLSLLLGGAGAGAILVFGIYFLGAEGFFTLTTILFFVMFGPMFYNYYK